MSAGFTAERCEALVLEAVGGAMGFDRRRVLRALDEVFRDGDVADAAGFTFGCLLIVRENLPSSSGEWLLASGFGGLLFSSPAGELLATMLHLYLDGRVEEAAVMFYGVPPQVAGEAVGLSVRIAADCVRRSRAALN